MKKWISLSLLLTLFTALTTAHADIILVPYSSDFVGRHPGEIVEHDREYLANGIAGSVDLCVSPDEDLVMVQEENGTLLWVGYRYKEWGYAVDREAPERIGGWIPMDQLVKVYNFESFAEEYGNQFEPYNGEFDNYSGPIDGIVFWEYPGAAEPKLIWRLRETSLSEATRPEDFSDTFTDEYGHLWGYIDEFGYSRNFWICLDKPLKTDFPTRAIPDYNLIPAKKAWFPEKMRLPAFLVLAVVSVTAGLLCGLRYKKRRQDKASEP